MIHCSEDVLIAIESVEFINSIHLSIKFHSVEVRIPFLFLLPHRMESFLCTQTHCPTAHEIIHDKIYNLVV